MIRTTSIALLFFVWFSTSVHAADVPAKWAALADAVKSAGGKIEFAEGNPVVIDMYNGNNPLKGRGGRNKAVNDDWLKHLSGIDSIKKLSLSNCDVTDAGMQHVGSLSGLEELNLTLTVVTDAGFAHLGKLTRLKNLGLASSQCTGAGFKHLNVKTLDRVNFHYTPLNDAGIAAICNVGVTGRFWFAHTHFTDAGAKSLAKLKNVQIIGIGSKDEKSSGEAVAELVDLPLVDLSLLDRQADPVGFQHAAKIKTLQKLDAGYAPKVTDAELKLVSSLPTLKEFRLGGAAQVTDEGIKILADCPSLKRLTLQGLKKVTADGIAELREKRPDIEIEVK